MADASVGVTLVVEVAPETGAEAVEEGAAIVIDVPSALGSTSMSAVLAAVAEIAAEPELELGAL